MKKIKVNQSGMTLTEVLVAMALFSIMFMMLSSIMYTSIKLNAQTRTYDQETDVQIEDVERYNPMGAVVEGVTSSSGYVSEYTGSNGTNKFSLTFDFDSVGKFITIDGYAYQAESRDEQNGFQLKFFNSTRPDTLNNRYWVRIINVAQQPENENVKVYLYLPKEDHGSFYLKNESEPYTTVATKTIPKLTALGIGYDRTGAAGNNLFWVSTIPDLTHEELENRTEENNFRVVTKLNLASAYDKDDDGYIDIYYTDDGFMWQDKYNEYVANGRKPF